MAEAWDDIPFPERARLVEELAADLDATEARAAKLARLGLDAGALADLADVHAPRLLRLLGRLPGPARDWVEWLAALAPLALVLFLISGQVPVATFLREGGAAIVVVLGIGSLALLLQFHRVFLWFVVRDHSAGALGRNTATPLYLAAATFLLGVLGTALDYYVVFFGWAEGRVDAEALKVGLREPLPCLLVGTSLATLVILIHGAMQAGLRALRVPLKGAS